MENRRPAPASGVEPPVRRSELTCPADNPRMLEKAAASAADEVILDLEDAVAASRKVAARATLIAALRDLDFGHQLRAFRSNGVRSPLFYRDLIEVLEAAGERVDVLVLPKVDAADDVRFADRLLSQIEAHRGLPVGRIRLEVLIESAAGLLAAAEIARASPRLASLIFGIADFAGDLGARDFSGESAARFHYPKLHILAAARAAGLDAIDHVTVNYRDLDQCRRDAQGALAMGYDGKWAIHPGQLPVIHEVFTPSAAQIARAQRIVEAYAAADQAGRGAIVIDDQMIDAASLRVERKVLAAARQAGLLPGPGIPE